MNKILDAVILVLIIVYSIGYFNIHHELFGIENQFFQMPKNIAENWDVIIWIIFVFMAVDIYIKYRTVGNWKIFLKKHWLEIIMLVLIPLFSFFIAIKFSLKLLKTLKMTKSGFKISQLIKKMTKSFSKKS